jgi:predicted small lipoprotein YifL
MKHVLCSVSFIIVVLSLTGCATPVMVSPADLEATNQAKTFQTKPGLAKVYFLGGKQGYSITPEALKPKVANGAIFLIDGNRVGQIEQNDVLVVDVIPKQYTFGWQYPPGDAQIQFLTRQVNAGDVLILQADLNMGGGAFGLIGLAINPMKYEITEQTNRGLVVTRRVVSHSGCPVTICR